MNHLYIYTPAGRTGLIGALSQSVDEEAGRQEDVSLWIDFVPKTSLRHRCQRVADRIAQIAAINPDGWFWFTSDDTLIGPGLIAEWRSFVAANFTKHVIMMRQRRIERGPVPQFLPASPDQLYPCGCDNHQFIFRTSWWQQFGYALDDFDPCEGATFAKLYQSDPGAFAFRDDLICLHDAQCGLKVRLGN